MQIVTVPEQTVLAATRQLRLPEAGAFLTATIPEMEAEARAWRLAFTGPWTFVSHNLPQDATTPFTLRICRPVEPNGATSGRFAIVTLPAFAPGEPCDSCRGDVNGDGIVNFSDLNEVFAAFGNVCPPIMLP